MKLRTLVLITLLAGKIYAQDSVQYKQEYTLQIQSTLYDYGAQSEAAQVNAYLYDFLSTQTTVYKNNPVPIKIEYSENNTKEDPYPPQTDSKEKVFPLTVVQEKTNADAFADYSLHSAVQKSGEIVTLELELKENNKRLILWRGQNKNTEQLAREGTELVKLILSGPSGRAQIESVPEASVYLGDHYLGRTPLTLTLPAGEHSFTVRKTGYQHENLRLTLQSNATTTINASLKPIIGNAKLYVTSNPPGASVFRGPEYAGKTPVTIENVQPGFHRIRWQKEGYSDKLSDIVIHGDDTLKLNAKLRPPEKQAQPVFTWERSYQAGLILTAIGAGTTAWSLVAMERANEEISLAESRGQSTGTAQSDYTFYQNLATGAGIGTVVLGSFSLFALYQHLQGWEKISFYLTPKESVFLYTFRF